MKGEKIGMIVRVCLVTGQPADKSKFNQTLRRISPKLADLLTEEVVFMPDG